MSILQTLLLSVVEGVTEFLPVSSTGHLIIVSDLLNIQQSEFIKSFEIIIQLGAILAVVVIYFHKIWNNFKLWKEILLAFIPTAVIGFIFYGFIKQNLIGNSTIVILSLFGGGIFMIFFEKYFKVKNKTLKTKDYLLIGVAQSLAMVPGISRAMATIFGGMIVGMDRKEATEFSFFLAIPTMLGASLLDLYKTDLSIWTNNNFVTLLLGFLASFITAYIVVKWLIKYVKSHNFNIFAWYRIALAILFFVFGL